MSEYYTYFYLRRDGRPYYVGKGSNGRVLAKDHYVVVPKERERIILQYHPSEAEAFEVEIFFIAYFGRIDRGTGCLHNHTDGGDGVSNPSSDVRRKMSLSHTGERSARGMLGKRHTSRTRELIAAASRGRVHSTETRQKLREMHLGKKNSTEHRKKQAKRAIGNKYHLGCKYSDESKKKISEKLRGKPAWNRGKIWSDEVRKRMSEAAKRRWSKI